MSRFWTRTSDHTGESSRDPFGIGPVGLSQLLRQPGPLGQSKLFSGRATWPRIAYYWPLSFLTLTRLAGGDPAAPQ